MACNVCLLGVIYYLCVREANAQNFLSYQMKSGVESAYPKASLQEMRKKTFQELVACLELEEEKLSQESALWILLHDYEVAIERFLGFAPSVSQEGRVQLTRSEYQRLSLLLQQERYPFSFKRCVEIFCKTPGDHELRYWILNTPEVFSARTLAHRCGVELSETSVLKLLVEAGPGLFSQLQSELRESGAWTEETWQRFLVRSTQASSKTAAYLLVMSTIHADESVDLQTQWMMLQLMDEKTQEAALFVKKLLEKPNLSEKLKEKAEERWAQFTQQDHSRQDATDRILGDA